MTERLRFIHVGLGSWGTGWAVNILGKSPEAEVVAWVDPDPAACDRARETLAAPKERFFGCLSEALASVSCDAVMVASDMASHAPVALTALRDGRHVLVEKPFAPTVSEAAEVVAEAKARGLVVSVSQNYRYFASMTALRAVSDAVGTIRRGRVEFRKNHPGRGVNPIDDDILTQLSIHHFDLMRALTGQEPVSAYCHTWLASQEPRIAAASAAAVILFDAGAVVSYTASRVSTAPETPWEGDWHLEGDGGEIAWAGGRLTVRGEQVPIPEAAQRERAAILAQFIAAVRDGDAPPCPGHDNIRSVALLDAARRSAATGERTDCEPV
jgi:predicted dehydrogenase